MNPQIEKYVVMALGAGSAALAAVPEWGQSKVGIAFLAVAAFLVGYLTPNMKSRQLAAQQRASMAPPAGDK